MAIEKPILVLGGPSAIGRLPTDAKPSVAFAMQLAGGSDGIPLARYRVVRLEEATIADVAGLGCTLAIGPRLLVPGERASRALALPLAPTSGRLALLPALFDAVERPGRRRTKVTVAPGSPASRSSATH